MSNQLSNYVPRRISVAEMAPHIHSFTSGENRVKKIAEWLVYWINKSLKTGNIKPYDYLPLKSDLAFHIGVSLGTMQNAFRVVEDAGYIQSKQRIGTYISPAEDDGSLKKLTSKREYAIEELKKYIKEKKLTVGTKLISARKLSAITNLSLSTLRNAFNALEAEGIIEKKTNSYFLINTKFGINKVENKTLVEKIANKIKEEIRIYSGGEKLPSNPKLAKKYNVSVKTIYDAIKLLTKEGLLITRRGQYGTIVASPDNEKATYSYERTEQFIKGYIMKKCKVGSKLPPIKELANMCKTSAKTVKRALDNISEDGYVTFARGRYGGTFVTDVPQTSGEAYTWLALSSEYTAGDNN